MARAIQVPESGRYLIDPVRSSIAFRFTLFGGLQKANGTMRVGEGEVTLDEGPSASVLVTIDAASFWTGDARRDDDIRSARWFDSEKYPEFTFRASQLEESHGQWSLTGGLTVRETMQPVTLALVSVELWGQGFRARASTRIDRTSFGFTRVPWMGGRFYDLDLVAVANPA